MNNELELIKLTGQVLLQIVENLGGWIFVTGLVVALGAARIVLKKA